MATAGSLTFEGGKELEKALGTLGVKVQRKVLKSTIRDAAKPMWKTARAKVARLTGLLAISLGIKTIAYKRGGTVASVIGARASFKGKKAQSIREGSSRAARAKPSKYAHLVEFGTKHSPPQPFMRPSFNQNHRKALRIIIVQAWAGIRKEAAKR